MGKKAKARREAKDTERSGRAEAREQAKEELKRETFFKEQIARSQEAARSIREYADKDDPALLQQFDATLGPAWVCMPLIFGSIPQILQAAMAAKCLSFFIKAVAREAGPRIAKKRLGDPDDILDALLDGVVQLDALAIRLKADDPRQEEIRDAIRSLFQHLPPESIEYLKRNFIGTASKDHFKHIEEERASEDCRMALERSTKQTTKTTGPRDLDRKRQA